METAILVLLILFPLLGYSLQRILDRLNLSALSTELPEAFRTYFDSEKYRKSQLYLRDNTRLSFWTSTLNIIIILVMIGAGGFALADRVAGSVASSEITVALVFFGLIGLGSEIVNLPFAWYDNFVIEKRYGFNKMTTRIFVTDQIKGWFLAVIIGAPVLALLTWIFGIAGSLFWIYAWVLLTVLSVLLNFFYSELIVPLFNKQKPLENGTLRSSIEAFAEKAGFKIKDIYIIDGSKRSTKANAYFSGFGAKKRIVLFDTLLSELSEPEIVAVLAHEIGHYRKKHVVINLLFSVLVTGIMLWLFSLIAGNKALAVAIGIEKSSFHISLVVFGILYGPASLLLGIISNIFSRKHEYEADAFVKGNGLQAELSSALKKLSVTNLSNLTPHPLYAFFHYSHPPLLKRSERLES